MTEVLPSPQVHVPPAVPAARRVVVVANPAAGRGKGIRLIPRVEEALRALGIEHELMVTRGPEDPERMAGEAVRRGADVVLAMGGDGSIGLCANAMVGSPAALAVVPAGTGNDFARFMGLSPKNPVAAVELLRSPAVQAIDVVRVATPERQRHFVNIGGVGFDSEVNLLANRTRFPGATTKYVYAVLATLVRFRAGSFTITVDGQGRAVRAMMVAVANGAQYGGGMKVAPDARFDDGILELCLVGELPRRQFVLAFPKVFRGRHVDHPKVTMLRGRDISVDADRPFQVFADGEHVGSVPAKFTVVPGALRLVVPRGTGEGSGLMAEPSTDPAKDERRDLP
jgi:YegS/Rv2252/BmrU family lipid kinase